MLGELLELIEGGRLRTIPGLSEELAVSGAMVEAMLFELERAGYLRRASASCEPGCQACRDRSGCLPGNFRGWIRTEKGKTP